MKKIVLLFCLLIPVFTFAQQPVVIELNEGWQFTQTGKDEWRNAEIPGSVQRDLIRHNVLPDPYYGTNETQVQWPESEDWDFKNILVLQNTFEKTRKQMKVNTLSINALSDNLNFPMFAKLILKKT